LLTALFQGRRWEACLEKERRGGKLLGAGEGRCIRTRKKGLDQRRGGTLLHLRESGEEKGPGGMKIFYKKGKEEVVGRGARRW